MTSDNDYSMLPCVALHYTHLSVTVNPFIFAARKFYFTFILLYFN